MTTAIAIFVKTPALSPLKTRLASTIGQDKAHEFYRLSLNAICETLGELNITPYWAIAEEEAISDPMWKDYQRLHTGDGNLGVRQHHIYQTLLQNYDNVLLIGSDAPQLSNETIEQAIKALETHDFTIGPAHDGGYYLFGGKADTDKSMWENTPWSSDITREILSQNLASTPHVLGFLTDIDTRSNLDQLKDEMAEHRNAAQDKLMEWIETL